MLQMENNLLHAIRVTIISDAPDEKKHKLKELYVIGKCHDIDMNTTIIWVFVLRHTLKCIGNI